MIRISGVNISSKKQARFALSELKGVGKSNVKKILDEVGIAHDAKLDSLDEAVINKLRNYIENNFLIEADLRRQVNANIKRLMDVGTYRGSRHKVNLPARGQRTRVNSRTRRGNKRSTAASGRAKAAAKT